MRVLHIASGTAASPRRGCSISSVQFVWLGRETAEKSDVNMTAVAREAIQEVSRSSRGRARPVRLARSAAGARQRGPARPRVPQPAQQLGEVHARQRGPAGLRRGRGAVDRDGLWVDDNGIGFDPAQAQSLFEPFRRLHSSNEYVSGDGTPGWRSSRRSYADTEVESGPRAMVRAGRDSASPCPEKEGAALAPVRHGRCSGG